ncbi:COX15/CtaA family protein [Thermoflavimicrobium dichotomicum]|uniref:Cytochrome c oxidase assembly protein subunit 15 n=1 Tax=Thermoflavimicrobium dichotomicum TaxID=46223 RepID=A0A1I3V4K3_9BACL|nr:heme A synthase [Thermoflavimicrobium dichotomicum]SFJ90175.1 cytochrome c oxidase assembly protein subunit 15 [Thermoflavimicrobium dichotomicum]
MSKHRWLRVLAVLTVIGSYLMLIMGAIVTKTGSGEGCGNSWPFCHGELIPASFPMETIIEYSHRIVSGGVGLLIVALVIWAWKAYPDSRRVKIFSFLSVFFVVFQGALGALTVVFRGPFAKKAALSLHFGFSLMCFASVVMLTIHLFQLKHGRTPEQETAKIKDEKPVSKRLQYGVWGLAVYTYLVVYTGALVRHTQATMACGFEFPLCGKQFLPGLANLEGIHMLHRYAGISLWFITLVFLWVIIRHYRIREDLHKGIWLAFLFITLQAVSGILTVLSGGQVLVALVHTTVISIYFSVLCYLCMQAGWPGGARFDKETPVLQS